MLAVVDNCSVAIFEAFLRGYLCSSDQEMSEELFVRISCLSKPSEPVAILGDNEEVGGGHGADVTEGQGKIVLIYHIGRNLLGDDLIE